MQKNIIQNQIVRFASMLMLVVLLIPSVGYAQNNSGQFPLSSVPESATINMNGTPSIPITDTQSTQNSSPGKVTFTTTNPNIPQNADYKGQDINKTPLLNNTGGGAAPVVNNTGTVAPVSNSSSGSIVPLKNPLQANSISEIIFTFMKLVSYLAVIFGVIMLMWVGLQLVLAQGKPDEIKKRTGQLLWVVIGIGVIIGARVLISAVINTLQATGTVNTQVIQQAQNALKTQ